MGQHVQESLPVPEGTNKKDDLSLLEKS